MTRAKTERWRAVRGFPLYWHHWDNEFVVYNSGSGDTHLLDVLAAEVLKILDRGPANLLELVQKVAASLEIEVDRDLSAYLETRLADFHKLGLIELI